MFDVNKVELEWAGKNLTIETGKIARQADASVVVTYGGTTQNKLYGQWPAYSFKNWNEGMALNT